MTEHKELISGLREVSALVRERKHRLPMVTTSFVAEADLMDEAARVIEEQAAEIARLRDALKPFARVVPTMWEMHVGDLVYDGGMLESDCVRVEAFHMARNVLTHPPETGS